MPLYDGTSELLYYKQPISLSQFQCSTVLSPHYAELLHHHEHDQRMSATVNSGTKRDGVATKNDEFMMYQFKVRRCPTGRGHHDWTDCHFLHPGEKARRRDPRKFVYSGKPCANFKKHGQCENGDKCHFAHGVFETWLHPDKYKTQMCRDGRNCDRKVCFFAHSKEETREGDNVIQDMSNLVSPKSVFYEHQSPSSSPPMSPTSDITQSFESLRLNNDHNSSLCVIGRGHTDHNFIQLEPKPIMPTETVQELQFSIDWIVEFVNSL